MSTEAITYSTAARAKAWFVHFYTALGLPLAVLTLYGAHEGDAVLFFIASIVACFVDATDGTMARRYDVKHVTPTFNGRKLDDIIDFLNFAFLPCIGMLAFQIFPAGFEWVVVIPLMASGYGFCQEAAKTEESFVGFPSYWNIVLLYLYVLHTNQWAAVGSVVLFSVLIFVPVHYIYPTRTVWLKKVTIGAGSMWALVMTVIAFNVHASWAYPVAVASMIYPSYYFIVSFMHHQQVMAE